MKYVFIVSLIIMFGIVNGQSKSNCYLDDFVTKDQYGRSMSNQILFNNLDDLSKNFENENTFLIKFYCFVTPVFNDSILTLKTDSIYIRGTNSVNVKNWEPDFRASLESFIEQIKPYVLTDSLMNSHCKTLIYNNRLRRCY